MKIKQVESLLKKTKYIVLYNDGIYTMSEGRKAEARLQAEIITILQKNNLNYKRASYLLNDCIALIGMAAKF